MNAKSGSHLVTDMRTKILGENKVGKSLLSYIGIYLLKNTTYHFADI